MHWITAPPPRSNARTLTSFTERHFTVQCHCLYCTLKDSATSCPINERRTANALINIDWRDGKNELYNICLITIGMQLEFIVDFPTRPRDSSGRESARRRGTNCGRPPMSCRETFANFTPHQTPNSDDVGWTCGRPNHSTVCITQRLAPLRSGDRASDDPESGATGSLHDALCFARRCSDYKWLGAEPSRAESCSAAQSDN